jgi:predicted GIY-YIG superfamily endonuclease
MPLGEGFPNTVQARFQASPQVINVTNLLITSIIPNVEEAIAREKQLKKWSRGEKVDLIEGMNPRWRDLGDDILGNI